MGYNKRNIDFLKK